MGSVELWQYKIVFLGNKGVGKHSLACRFTGSEPTPFVQPPPGIAAPPYKERKLVRDGKEMVFQFHETLGQEAFRSLTSSYFRNAAAIIYVYDETDAQSFKDLSTWVETGSCYTNGAMSFVVGNKTDLLQPNGPRPVTEQQAQTYANTLFASLHHVSALSGSGTEEAFNSIIQQLIQHAKPQKRLIESDDGLGDDALFSKPKQQKKKRCIC